MLALALVPAADPEPVAADLVLRGGRVWTVDSDRPEAEAVAVWQGRILKVGTDAEIKPLVGPKTRVIPLNGRRVVPGFHDSHLHFLGGGQQLARVELKDAKDEAEFGRRLREFDAKLPKGRWMLGGNWDHDRTFAGKLPTAATLDKYVPDRPVFIQRYDGHMGLANTGPADGEGDGRHQGAGRRRHLSAGRRKDAVGILKDNAMGLVERLVPEPGPEETRRPSGRDAGLRRERYHQCSGHGRQFERDPADAVSGPPEPGPATER